MNENTKLQNPNSRMKHQTPSSKTPKKLQFPSSNTPTLERHLGFGVWIFSGAWCLVFGVWYFADH